MGEQDRSQILECYKPLPSEVGKCLKQYITGYWLSYKYIFKKNAECGMNNKLEESIKSN